jgi:hypothetical protein
MQSHGTSGSQPTDSHRRRYRPMHGWPLVRSRRSQIHGVEFSVGPRCEGPGCRHNCEGRTLQPQSTTAQLRTRHGNDHGGSGMHEWLEMQMRARATDHALDAGPSRRLGRSRQ